MRSQKENKNPRSHEEATSSHPSPKQLRVPKIHLLFLTEEPTALLLPRAASDIARDAAGATVAPRGPRSTACRGSEVRLREDVADVIERVFVDADCRVAVAVLPLAVDDELELVRPGRHLRHNRPHAAALVEHLDSLPVVPVARQLHVVLRAVGEDELRLDALETPAWGEGKIIVRMRACHAPNAGRSRA